MKNVQNPSRFYRFLAVLSVSTMSSMLMAQPAFEDKTAVAGLTHSGETWGVSWGDLNGDGFPDAFVGNHREPPSLYLNNGDGTFAEVMDAVDASGVWDAKPREDNHGAAWADFDGDGDQDLYVTVSAGGGAPGHLFVNEGGVLFDRAAQFGLENDSNARSPVWVDYDEDGDLDMIFMNYSSARVYEHRNPRGAIDFDREYYSGMDCSRMDYGHLSDFNGDGVMEFICADGTYPVGIYDLTSFPFTDITSISPTVVRTTDSTIADFDGDLDPDVFIITGQKHPSGVGLVDSYSLEASIGVGPGVENGITFESNGLVTFSIEAKDDFNDPNFFYIGSSGWHPGNVPFTLDPSDPAVVGIFPHDPEQQGGVFIGYDPSQQQWRLLVSSLRNDSAGAYFEVSSTATINNPQLVLLEPEDLPRKPELLMNVGGTFVAEGGSRGFNEKIQCVSVVSGDFDNDGDPDLYLVCRDGVQNLANRLYENLGAGTFAEVATDHGAYGIQGFHLADGAGLGESVVTADYDADGCLDFFVTNGLPMRPLRHDSGPDQIFRNACNYGNHWVEVDLRGNWPATGGANPDGVGATVYVTAGGMTQMREQNGGHHRWSQNHQRLHFGLGTDSAIDELKVVWSNGTVDIFQGDIPADRIYLAQEGATELQLVELVTTPPPGIECGQPPIDQASEQGLFVWRECPSNTWRVQATAATPDTIIYDGDVTAEQPFPSAPLAESLESSDVLDDGDPLAILYTMKVKNSGYDGFAFEAPTSGSTCFRTNRPMFIGVSKQPAGTTLDLATLSACVTPPELIVDDVMVNEADGTATFTVSLSASSIEEVRVDYATADVTATDPDDYTGVSGTLILAPDTLSGEVVVPIIDDGDSEGPETFVLNLSNPVNALITTASAAATIEDNEVDACGEPAIDKSSETGVFLWRDCPSNSWQMRVTAGGGPKIVYRAR